MKGKVLSLQEFVHRANAQHDSFYDYSKVIYKNAHTKVCIMCPIHNEFFQRPFHHLKGNRCPECNHSDHGKKVSLSKEEFIKRSVLAHDMGVYDYSKVDYRGVETKVCIICPNHGEFWQTPNNHMKGHDCIKCVNEKKRSTLEEFISQARELHGNKYDYSKVIYKSSLIKVCIHCDMHGDFWQTPSDHLSYGCPKCGILKAQKSNRSTGEEFIIKAVSLYGNRYDYSKINYINSKTKICIVCPKHGEFWQTPNDHLRNHNCAKCNISQGEKKISEWLEKQGMQYKQQYKFSGLVGKGGRPLKFDFYIPSQNQLIEFDGEQHFKPMYKRLSKERAIKIFEHLKHNDNLKDQYCERNGAPLLRINFKDIKKIPEILTEKVLGTQKVLEAAF